MTTNRLPTDGDVCILCLAKGDERFVFIYDDETQSAALRTIGRFAANPELSFTWHDAATLSQKVRKLAAGKRNA